MKTSAPCRDNGETLLESLISMVVVAIGLTGLVVALGSGVSFGDHHQKTAAAQVVLRNLTEAIKAGPYEIGAGVVQVRSITAAGFQPVAGYDESVKQVLCWTGGSGDASSGTDFVNCTPTGDKGLQLVYLEVSTADGRGIERLAVLKRCDPAIDLCPFLP